MPAHQINLANGITGNVEISNGNVTIEFPTGNMNGIVKRYTVELVFPTTGGKIKFNIYKDPNGKWWDAWFLPFNPDADKDLIDATKKEIDKMGI